MRIEFVRRCPGVPEGLNEALDRAGEGFCTQCGETVVDLTRGVVPVGRVIRCARVLVVAAVVGCGGSPAKPAERVIPASVAVEEDGGTTAETPASEETQYVVVSDDALANAMAMSGGIVIREDDAGTPKDSGR